MLAQLAQRAVEKIVRQDQILKADSSEIDQQWLERKAGVFVTLKKNGELRGCIGSYLPTQDNVAQEVIHNAVGAATRDHRFGSVTQNELSELSFEVQVLSEPEAITGPDQLNPDRYGIVVKSVPSTQKEVGLKEKTKTAVLLPDLEGIDTAEKQISVACRKARINPAQGKIKIWRFTTESYT